MRGSILNNSNRAVSSSEDSWGSVRDNTLIKFGRDSSFYTISHVKKFLFIKNFTKIEPNKIKINDDVEIDICENDCIQISYKEYELLTVLNPINKGFGYKLSDNVFLEGGEPNIDPITGKIYSAKLIVSKIGENGEIEQLRMEEPGKYLETPPKQCKLLGGSGVRACMEVDYKVIDDRNILEKTIIEIIKGIGYTEIKLDSGLPNGISFGKLSINKWEAFLTANYAGETQINKDIELVRDFTPFLRIPTLAKNNQSPEIIYNLAILSIDKKLQDIQNRIEKLELRIIR